MNLEPSALADALRTYAEQLHQEAVALPNEQWQTACGLFSDQRWAEELAKRIAARERTKKRGAHP